MADPIPRPPVTDWATDFDPFDADFTADPFPVYDELRSRCPIAHSDRYHGMTMLTRFADVSEAAHHPEVFSSERIVHQRDPDRETRPRSAADQPRPSRTHAATQAVAALFQPQCDRRMGRARSARSA